MRWPLAPTLALPCLVGCVAPFLTPPVRAELGASVSEGDRAVHAGGGVHLASATRGSDQRFDLGVGGFGDWYEHLPSQGGLYVEAAVFVERNARRRTAVGGRGELLWANGMGTGTKLRVDHELFGGGTKDFSSSDMCGFMHGVRSGTLAIGLFAEAGRVWLPDAAAWVATAGITMRLPATVGVAAGIPGCRRQTHL